MGANNFVQELANLDYLEFARKILYLDNKYQLDKVNEELECIRIELKRKGLFPSSKIIVEFRDFDYTIEMCGRVYKEDIMLQTEWRIFMTKRFGDEYVNAYQSFVEKYMEKMEKDKNLMSLKFKFYDEIERLRKGEFENEAG